MPKLGMKEIRKDQVIAATMRCIINKGLSKMSVKDIAAEAGVSTGIIYHYFKNKDDVLLQVLKESFRKSDEQVIQTVAPLTTSREKLSNHISSINHMSSHNPEFIIVLMNYLGEATYNPHIHQIINKFFNNLQSYMRDYLSDELSDDNNIQNIPVILYALGLGLGVMRTLNSEAYNLEEIDLTVKKIITSYLSIGSERK
ncbi:TetR/AcrR family transcriptional regulator [Bacillus sp. JJ722]|uniref:TetR/AcrR family transcriptional regulator n=1 Tax=Bacillus sp. JJ722 TaxID=3122973 RepID=UPI003000D377